MNSIMLDGALKILRLLNENGYEAYIVGGYTRDRLLGIEGKDIDITTNAKPNEIEAIFPKTYNKSQKFQTICVWMNKCDYEVTTYRVDIKYGDHRHPETKISKSLREDIKRRDFTINSICMDKDLKIVDYVDGIEDLEKKVIKTVGSPIRRFTEDSLRMFRAFRFSARYNFEIDSRTYSAIKTLHSLSKFVSKERVKDELTKILNEPYFENVLPKIIDTGLLKPYPMLDKALIILNNNYQKLEIDEFIALASKVENKFCDELILSKKESKTIKTVIEYTNMLESRRLSKHKLLDLDFDSLKTSFKILEILNNVSYSYDEIIDLYNSFEIKSMKDLDIDGSDIKKALNLEDSPKIKEYINILRDKVLDGIVKNNKDDLIECLKELNN